MSEINKVEAWIKSHKAASAAIAGGAGFIYLQRRGNAADSGGDLTTTSVATLPPDNSALQDTSPLDEAVTNAQQSADNAADQASQVSDALTTLQDSIPDPTPTTSDTGDSAPDSVDTGTAGASPAPAEPTPPVAVVQGSGITLAGHHFAGATGSQIVGAGSNSNGHYTTHLIIYPGRTERWNHYSSGKKAGQWVGPFGGNVTSSAPAGSAPSPTPVSTAPPPPPVRPAPLPPPPPPPNPVPAGWDAGNDISGRTFPNAVAHHVYERGSNSRGSFTGHEIKFHDGHLERWHHYTSGKSAGQWTQT